MRLKPLAIALGLTALFGVALPTPAPALEITEEIYELCSRFPLNSRCEGYEVPIPLDQRDGIQVGCFLASDDSDRPADCKFLIDGDTLSVYMEQGDRLAFLDDQRSTREIVMSFDQIFVLGYLEHARVALVNQWGYGSREQLGDIEIGFATQPDAGQSGFDFVVLVMRADAGRELLPQLVQATNAQADGSQSEAVTSWLASSGTSPAEPESLQSLMQDSNCESCDFRGVDFSEQNLNSVNLRFANLQGANLTSVSLEEASLKGSNLRGANLENAVLMNADLTPQFRRRTSLRYANLRNADLTGAQLEGADLGGANLSSASLAGVNLSMAVTYGTTLTNQLRFRIRASLIGADLSNATLPQADLGDAFLMWADFSSADLTGVDLESADLTGANLQNANLSNTKLKSASFEEANLLGADLTDVQDFESVNFCGATMPDGSISEQGCE